MEADHKLKPLILSLLVTISIPTLKANIAKMDDHWEKRQELAELYAKAAYREDPMENVYHLNKKVHEHYEVLNGTRRGLREHYSGPCQVTNPIDACWRCDPGWAENRQKLADCALGFGFGTTGGKGGEFYEVTDSSDDELINPKPGTLRYGVTRDGPLWITFARSMKIKLKEELMINSDKTIDARGANIRIVGGAQITLQYVQNIIISNIHIRDIKPGEGGMIRDSVNHFGIRTKSDGDGISLFGAQHVWIDHVSASNCKDGLIDAVAGSTAVTISNSHFTHHNDVMLFGSSDSTPKDEVMQITVAFNIFGQGLIQRMPRVRFGCFHIVNNDYTHWIMYAIGGTCHPTIFSQGNRFNAADTKTTKEICSRLGTPESVWRSWKWATEGDLFLNGATFTDSGGGVEPPPNAIPGKPGEFVKEITLYAGPLKCKPGKECKFTSSSN